MPQPDRITVADEADAATFSGPEFSLRFDKKDGLITAYRYKGVDLLERGPRPDFWRAPTNNDRGAWKDLTAEHAAPRNLDYRVWKDAGPLWRVKDVRVDKVDSATARIAVQADLPGAASPGIPFRSLSS